MNSQSFQEMVYTALNNPVAEQRNIATQQYFYLLNSQPRVYLLNIFEIFDQQPDLHAQAAILLRKNISSSYMNCALVVAQDFQLNDQILIKLLQMIAENHPNILILADCVAEMVKVLMSKQDVNCAIQFSQQAISESVPLPVQVSAGKIFAAIMESTTLAVTTFGLDRILQILSQLLGSQDFAVSEQAVCAICNILMGASYAQYSSEQQQNIPDATLQELLNALMQKLCTMAAVQFDQRQQKLFINSLNHFHEILEMAIDLLSDHIEIVYQLIEALISSGSEELFKKGLSLLEAFCDTSASEDHSAPFVAKIIQLLVQHVFPAVSRFDEVVINDFINAENPELKRDDMPLQVFIEGSMLRIFGVKLLDIAVPALKLFIESKKNESFQFKYTVVFLINCIIKSESYEIGSIAGDLVAWLKQFISDISSVIIYKVLIASCQLINQLDSEFSEVLVGFTNDILPFIQLQLNTQYRCVQAMILRYFSNLQAVLLPEKFLQYLDVAIVLINGFSVSPSLFVQGERIRLLRMIVQQMPENITVDLIRQQFDRIRDSFFTFSQQLNPQLGFVEVDFFNEITNTLALFVIRQKLDDQIVNEIVLRFIQLLVSPIANQLHSLMDVLIDSFVQFSEAFPLCLAQFVDQIIPVFVRITRTPVFEHKDTLEGDDNQQINKHIITQHKIVMKVYSQLVRTCPQQMLQYFSLLLDCFDELNLFKFYDFIYQVETICQIPAVALRFQWPEFPLLAQRCMRMLDLAIQPDGERPATRRCVDEACVIIASLQSLIPVMSTSQELMRVINYVHSVSVSAMQSYKHFMQNIALEGIPQSEQEQVTLDTRLEVQRCADSLGSLMNQILSQDAGKPIIAASIEIAKQCYSIDPQNHTQGAAPAKRRSKAPRAQDRPLCAQCGLLQAGLRVPDSGPPEVPHHPRHWRVAPGSLGTYSGQARHLYRGRGREPRAQCCDASKRPGADREYLSERVVEPELLYGALRDAFARVTGGRQFFVVNPSPGLSSCDSAELPLPVPESVAECGARAAVPPAPPALRRERRCVTRGPDRQGLPQLVGAPKPGPH